MDIENEYKSNFNIKDPPPMLKTWFSALTKPTVANYRRLAAHKGITIGTAVRWYFIALILAAIFNYILINFYTPQHFSDWTIVRDILNSIKDDFLQSRGIIILYFGFQGVMIQIRFVLMSVLLLFVNWLADKNGAVGIFDKFAYISIAWLAPFTVFSPILNQSLYIYTVAIVFRVLIFSYFMITTLRAIKRLSISKALLVTGVPVVIYLVPVTLWFLFLLNLAN